MTADNQAETPHTEQTTLLPALMPSPSSTTPERSVQPVKLLARGQRSVLAAWVALALGCAMLAYGLWRYRDILRGQPIWAREVIPQLLAVIGIYVLAALVLRALPSLASRIAASVLVTAFVSLAAGPRAVLAAALVGAGCLAAGDLIVRRIPTGLRFLDRILLSALAGATLLALLVTVTAHFPVNRASVFAVVCVAAVIVDLRGLKFLGIRAVAWLRRPREPETGWTYTSAALLGGVVLLLSVRAILPETGGDGLGMHLVVASQLASHHQWSFDTSLFQWAVYPMASEWLQGVGWTLAGEEAARLVEFGFMLASIAAIVAAARRFASPAAALLAGSLFASAGLAFGLAANTYAEPALTAFVLGAFVLITMPRGCWSAWHSVLLGILCGGCLLTKVTAVYLLPPLVVVLASRIALRDGWRRASRLTGIAVALLAAVGAAPYAYALFRTGDPVFPLYNGIFHSSLAPLRPPPDARWIDHFTWTLPFVATFRTSYYVESYNGTLGYHYLALLPLALVVIELRRLWRAAAALAVGLFGAIALLVSMQYVRYVFPMLGLASIAVAAAFVGGSGFQWRWIGRVTSLVAVGIVGLNLLFAPGGQWNLPGFEVAALFSPKARQAYEDKYAPQRALNATVNELAGSSARVAYFGPAYAAGIEGTPLLAMGYDPAFQQQVAKATSGEQLLRVFDERRIGYVITPLDIAAAGTPLGDALAAGAQQVKVVNGAGLFRLSP